MADAPDLFLSHNSEDKPLVREVAKALRRRRYTPWLDQDDLVPGRSWQELAEEAIRICKAGAVFVGASGLGPWEKVEVRALLTQAVKRGRERLGPHIGAFSDFIRCVVLNACYTHEQAAAIAEDIDCVVGMPPSISDDSAIRFSPAFYQALSFGRNVLDAFHLACAQMDLAGLDEGDMPKLIALRQNPSEIVLVDSPQGNSQTRTRSRLGLPD